MSVCTAASRDQAWRVVRDGFDNTFTFGSGNYGNGTAFSLPPLFINIYDIFIIPLFVTFSCVFLQASTFRPRFSTPCRRSALRR